MRRLFFKEDGLQGQVAPEGYKAFGFSDGAISVVGTSSNDISGAVSPTPFVYRSDYFDVINEGHEMGKTSTTSPYSKIDLDLRYSSHNLILIKNSVEKVPGFSSVKLPEKWGSYLSNMLLEFVTFSKETTKINLNNYPNLNFIGGKGVTRQLSDPFDSKSGISGNKPYTLEIVNQVWDLPYLKSMRFGQYSDSTGIKCPSDVTIKANAGNRYYLSSDTIEYLTLDFSSFTYSSIDENGNKEFVFECIIKSANLKGISFSNIGVLSEINEFSTIRFDFPYGNLSQAAVDYILETIDDACPNSVFDGSYGYGYSYGGESDCHISFIEDELSSTNGTLIIGNKYVIESQNIGDDFSNVGYVKDSETFIATSDTPNNWSNGTEVIELSGKPVAATFSFIGEDILPDGTYMINDSIFFEISGGEFSKTEILTTNSYQVLSYEGYVDVIKGGYFVKYDEMGRKVFQGKDRTHDIRFEITEVTRTSSPTGGLTNVNKQSLDNKGWNIIVNKYQY